MEWNVARMTCGQVKTKIEREGNSTEVKKQMCLEQN